MREREEHQNERTTLLAWVDIIGYVQLVGIQTLRTGKETLSPLSVSPSLCFFCSEIPHLLPFLSIFTFQKSQNRVCQCMYLHSHAISSSNRYVTSEFSVWNSIRGIGGREMLEAVESSVNGGFSQLQSCGESSEEELSVLPRHTKVVVRGNNRTKSVLVGLQGVVKKAVGLGGWHWLVLTNGIEVKLQRNALSVIEAPTGQEEDDDMEYENMQGSDMASDDTQKFHRPRHRSHRTAGLAYKATSRSHSFDSQSKGSDSSAHGVTVDLSKLGTPALWRYWQYFNLVDSIPNPTKEQLIEVVQSHFTSLQLDELQVLVGFMQAAKRMKTVYK